MMTKTASGIRPELRARIGRRVATATGLVTVLAVVAAALMARAVSSRIDRDPVALMSVSAAPSQPQLVFAEEPIIVQPTLVAVITDAKAGSDSQAVKPVEAVKPRTAVHASPTREPGPVFDGRPIRRQRTIEMVVTGYSPDARSCGASADGITASGYSVWTNGMYLVAADTRLLPFGSVISIPGYNGGQPVPVLDRGGAIKGTRLDLLFPTHEAARAWGRKTVKITVWEYAD